MKINLLKTFAANMKKRRTALKITQKNIATKMGLANSTVNHWETMRTDITLRKLSKLSKILKTTPADMLRG